MKYYNYYQVNISQNHYFGPRIEQCQHLNSNPQILFQSLFAPSSPVVSIILTPQHLRVQEKQNFQTSPRIHRLPNTNFLHQICSLWTSLLAPMTYPVDGSFHGNDVIHGMPSVSPPISGRSGVLDIPQGRNFLRLAQENELFLFPWN